MHKIIRMIDTWIAVIDDLYNFFRNKSDLIDAETSASFCIGFNEKKVKCTLGHNIQIILE